MENKEIKFLVGDICRLRSTNEDVWDTFVYIVVDVTTNVLNGKMYAIRLMDEYGHLQWWATEDVCNQLLDKPFHMSTLT